MKTIQSIHIMCNVQQLMSSTNVASCVICSAHCVMFKLICVTGHVQCVMYYYHVPASLIGKLL